MKTMNELTLSESENVSGGGWYVDHIHVVEPEPGTCYCNPIGDPKDIGWRSIFIWLM